MKRLTSLPSSHVFVFGSSTEGNHSGGAAADAVRYFGAVMGQTTGLQGKSYAIPTVDYTRRGDHKLPLDDIRTHVLDFRRFASEHPKLTFHVAPIGCGIAGLRGARHRAALLRHARRIERRRRHRVAASKHRLTPGVRGVLGPV